MTGAELQPPAMRRGGALPDAFDHFEGFNAFRQGLSHDDGDFRFGGALVFVKFYKPAVAPVSGPFRLPQNRAARLAEWADDAMQYSAVSDSVSLISVLRFGQTIVGSVVCTSCLARQSYSPSFLLGFSRDSARFFSPIFRMLISFH